MATQPTTATTAGGVSQYDITPTDDNHQSQVNIGRDRDGGIGKLDDENGIYKEWPSISFFFRLLELLVTPRHTGLFISDA